MSTYFRFKFDVNLFMPIGFDLTHSPRQERQVYGATRHPPGKVIQYNITIQYYVVQHNTVQYHTVQNTQSSVKQTTDPNRAQEKKYDDEVGPMSFFTNAVQHIYSKTCNTYDKRLHKHFYHFSVNSV